MGVVSITEVRGFAGDLDRPFRAFDAGMGKALLGNKASLPRCRGFPLTFTAGGKQYVVSAHQQWREAAPRRARRGRTRTAPSSDARATPLYVFAPPDRR